MSFSTNIQTFDSLHAANRNEEDYDGLKQAAARIDSFDSELRRLNSKYRRHRDAEDAGWRDAQLSLRPGEAVVEYVAAALSPHSSTRGYLALVPTGRGAPTLMPICDEADIGRVFGTRSDRFTVSLLPLRQLLSSREGNAIPAKRAAVGFPACGRSRKHMRLRYSDAFVWAAFILVGV